MACNDVQQIAGAAKSNRIAFAFVSPTDYVKLHDSAGMEAVATKCNKGGTPYCQGTVVTPKAKGVKGLAGLKGKTVHFGPEGSFNKNLAALEAFQKHGVDAKKDLKGCSYGGGCGGIADTVLAGKADAGVVCDYSWDGWTKSGNERAKKLRVIGKGPKLRDMAVAASAKTPTDLRNAMVECLTSLSGEAKILTPPLKATGFQASKDSDYDSLRQVIKSVKAD